MEKLLWCVVVLIGFSNAFGQKDMSRKAFVFPKVSDDSYVSLKAQLKEPLKAFTVCFHIYTELAMTRGPNVLDWKALTYEAHGEVFVKPQLWP
ncbi:C-reactive protein isoform X3 [Marmota flaviventris]|uniref:C-reactive protein isoform X3 n=1 Tax=Marmota flaviventris TaxID=93162 RepID=UPI000FFFB544|nr:C-reactive protein isoform X2 [Marmota flaviventris]